MVGNRRLHLRPGRSNTDASRRCAVVCREVDQTLMAQIATHNAPEVLRSSGASKQQVTRAMHYANRKTADAGQEFVRQYIPPPKGKSLFPGYKATGALRNAVSVVGPIPISGGVKSEIYMAQDKTKVYQRIHEFGSIS